MIQPQDKDNASTVSGSGRLPVETENRFMSSAEEAVRRVAESQNRAHITITRLKGEILAGEEKAAHLERSLIQRDRDLQTVRASLATVEARLEASQREAEQRQAEAIRKGESVDSLKAQISSIRRELDAANEKLHAKNAEHSALFTRFESIIKALNNGADDLDSEFVDAEQESVPTVTPIRVVAPQPVQELPSPGRSLSQVSLVGEHPAEPLKAVHVEELPVQEATIPLSVEMSAFDGVEDDFESHLNDALDSEIVHVQPSVPTLTVIAGADTAKAPASAFPSDVFGNMDDFTRQLEAVFDMDDDLPPLSDNKPVAVISAHQEAAPTGRRFAFPNLLNSKRA